MWRNSRLLLVAIVCGLGAASAYSQDFSADLQRRTPADALLCVEAPDLPRLFESLAETAVAKALHRLPLARISQKVVSSRNWGGDDAAIDDWDVEQSSLLAELAQFFSGSSSLVVAPEGDSIGYLLHIGLSQDSPVVRTLMQALRNDHRSMGLVAEEGDDVLPLYRHSSGLVVGCDGERLLVGDSKERVLAWFKGRPWDTREGNLTASRKWLRVKENLGVRGSHVSGYCDTRRLIDIYLEGHPQGQALRRLMAASAVSDALALGWSLRVGGQEADLQLDAFLLCALPRQGIWGALSLAPLDQLQVPHCPADVGYALVVRSDLPELVRSLSDASQLVVEEELMTPNEFLTLLGRTAPPLVLPLILRDRAKEFFSGECFMFGRAEVSRRQWFNNASLGAGIVRGMEAEVWEVLAGIIPTAQAFERRTTEGHEWWIQNEQSYQNTVNRVREREEELDDGKSDDAFIPRPALVCSDGRLILFSSDTSVEPSFAVTHDVASGIEFDEEFDSVVEYIERTGPREAPALLLFCRAEESIKWPLYHWADPASANRFRAWQQYLDQHPQASKQSLLADAHKAWAESREQWPSSADLAEGVGPIGAAVWDTPAGFQGSFFLLRRESHGPN